MIIVFLLMNPFRPAAFSECFYLHHLMCRLSVSPSRVLFSLPDCRPCACAFSAAHQAKPPPPTPGGGEQGASAARDDHVLGHRRLLAHQHLGVAATLVTPPQHTLLPPSDKHNALFLICVSCIRCRLHSAPPSAPDHDVYQDVSGLKI